MITVKMDSKLLQKRLADIGVDVTNDANASLKQHARLLAQNLAFQTAPFGLNKASQKMGENTILGDIMGRDRTAETWSVKRSALFLVINESKLKKEAKKAPNGTRKLWVSKEGRVYGVEETFFKPNASIEEMRTHHKKYYKNGHRTRAGTFTRDIGRWRFIDKMTVGKDSMKKYLQWIFQRVGMSKAGWVRAGSVFGKVTKIPAWVSRHVANARGSGKMHKISQHSFAITLTNHIPWSDRIMGKSGMEAALQITKEKYLDHLRHKKLGTKRKK
jgi:hypothetical protein